jgi:hypothetical protein
VQIPDTALGDTAPFLQAFRRREDHVVSHIGTHLPDVAGVRLLDVDDVECDAVLVLPVKPVERGNLPAEWRSSIAAEDEDDGLPPAERTQTDLGFLIQRAQMEITRHIAWSQRPRSRARPERLEREDHKQRSRHFRDGRGETLRRLAHKSIDGAEKNCVESDESNRDPPGCSHTSLKGSASVE